jgi:predicted nucleic acid-binding protein
MSDRTFIDTNVILYSKDARDTHKQSIADELVARGIREGTMVVSAQVLNEFYVNATQKLDPGMNREDARTVCRSLSAVSCEPVTDETIAKAWSVQDRFGLSWWDSLIVASALLAGCSRLVTEDLQDALQIDGLKVVNPFVKRSPTI